MSTIHESNQDQNPQVDTKLNIVAFPMHPLVVQSQQACAHSCRSVIEDNSITPEQQEACLLNLKQRLESKPTYYHADFLRWRESIPVQDVLMCVRRNVSTVLSLSKMHEPDIMNIDPATNQIVFAEMSQDTPIGENRRGISYSHALQIATDANATMMSLPEYVFGLQKVGQFDTDSSVWLHVRPPDTFRHVAKIGYNRNNTVVTTDCLPDHTHDGKGFRLITSVPISTVQP